MKVTEELILQSYNIINATANSNVVLQGLSGIVGFPGTLVVDGATIFTHYAPLIDKIRLLFGKEPLSKGVIVPILKSISSEVIFDIIFDKVAGQIPIVGVYFNAICAKTLTWRIGIMFAVMSSLENDITDIEALKKISELIRNVFPQKEAFKFIKPNYNVYKKILISAGNDDEKLFIDKVNKALEAFEI